MTVGSHSGGLSSEGSESLAYSSCEANHAGLEQAGSPRCHPCPLVLSNYLVRVAWHLGRHETDRLRRLLRLVSHVDNYFDTLHYYAYCDEGPAHSPSRSRLLA